MAAFNSKFIWLVPLMSTDPPLSESNRSKDALAYITSSYVIVPLT